MMPSALNRICRSAAAIGPFGSSTPSVQPPSIAAPTRTAANKPYRMLDLAEVDGAACAAGAAWREFGMHRNAAAGMRRPHGRERATPMVGQESRKQDEQIDDGEHEQPVRSAAIGLDASVQ